MANQDLPVISYKGRKKKGGYKKGFFEKSESVQTLIRESLHIVQMLGIPTDDLTDEKKKRLLLRY